MCSAMLEMGSTQWWRKVGPLWMWQTGFSHCRVKTGTGRSLTSDTSKIFARKVAKRTDDWRSLRLKEERIKADDRWATRLKLLCSLGFRARSGCCSHGGSLQEREGCPFLLKILQITWQPDHLNLIYGPNCVYNSLWKKKQKTKKLLWVYGWFPFHKKDPCSFYHYMGKMLQQHRQSHRSPVVQHVRRSSTSIVGFCSISMEEVERKSSGVYCTITGSGAIPSSIKRMQTWWWSFSTAAIHKHRTC